MSCEAPVLSELVADPPEEDGHDQAVRNLRTPEFADALCAGARHLHGLTKPATKLVKLAASVHGAGPEKAAPALAAAAKRLSPADGTILRESLRLAAGPLDEAAFAAHGSTARLRSMHGIAQRVAAIVRLAEGIALLPGAADAALAVADDGERFELHLAGDRVPSCEPITAFEAAGLWDRVALRPLVGVRFAGAPPAEALAPTQPWLEAGRRIFLQQVEQILAREYGLGYADDIEFVHEMRVATRRLRAAMRTFRNAVPGEFKEERARIGALADALGKPRDADVFLAFLEAYSKKAKPAHRKALAAIFESQRRGRQAVNRKLIQLCAAAEQRAFMESLLATLRAPAGSAGGLNPAGKKARRPLWRGARKAMRQAFSAVLAYDRPLAQLSSDEQHQLRIACKKLRYTAEFFGSLYPERMKALVAMMVQLQDLLGEGHDADVFSARIAQLQKKAGGGAGRPRAAAVRAVQEHLKRRKQRLVSKARGVWKEFDRPEILDEMRTLIESPRRE